jgi:integrase
VADSGGEVMPGDLRTSAQQYLALRRAMGYQLIRNDELIGQFLDYLDSTHQNRISVDHALAWACLPGQTRPRWHTARLTVIRGFAAFVHANCAADGDLIPAGLLPGRVERPVPYLYTPDQIVALIKGASELRPLIRALTLSTVIGLMAATGIRISEALAMDTTSIDAAEPAITVTGKYAKVRQIPVHATTISALSTYLRNSRVLVGAPAGGSLFVTVNATRPRANNVETAFRTVATAIGLRATAGSRPHLHGLRHAFAVNTLIDAHRAGVDVDARIAALATYLGHVSPASTYWYLSASPELLDLTADRVESFQRSRTS